jgi:predicted transposase/invertase (TIGR01784 family)
MNDYKNRKFYDESFAEVFANRKMLESLLIDFVTEPWVTQLDFGSMRIERSLFKAICRGPRSNDLLVSYTLLGGLTNSGPWDTRVFLLIEFQSTPENMGRRLFEYRNRLHARLLQQKQRATPVVPIVIYNGRGQWMENTERLTGNLALSDRLENPTCQYR